MKRYNMDNIGVPEESEDGLWVDADIAQEMHDVLRNVVFDNILYGHTTPQTLNDAEAVLEKIKELRKEI